ncbi:hypothetical protein [Caballeronia sp. NK8]|uniref:hypothetical protein n=1 Tax=Caballeronia sp. NK8 TaxID=140098 RepID=UPI001BCD558A|nr:hypothetical protein [Caballeronia sp. NK8]
MPSIDILYVISLARIAVARRMPVSAAVASPLNSLPTRITRFTERMPHQRFVTTPEATIDHRHAAKDGSNDDFG